MEVTEKMQRCHEYSEALEEERKKILVFQRELPLSLELVTQAIETCKKELSGGRTTESMHGHSESSEQTWSTEGPLLLAEFVPLKRIQSSTSDDEDDLDLHLSNNVSDHIDNNVEDHSTKSEWLRSVQLWNPSPDPPSHEEEQDLRSNSMATELMSNGGAFQPFHKEKIVGNYNQTAAKDLSAVPAPSKTSDGEKVGSDGIGNKKESKEGQSQKKQRRSWSPELHRRFLNAIQQLGGSHAATPKQIRELMKVNGLTNDEVKSHLQKFRLHTRKPGTTMHNDNSNGQQAPQFVLVGGIWMPPVADYITTATGAASAETGNGIYAPLATLALPTSTTIPQVISSSIPQKPKQNQSQGNSGCSQSAGSSTSSSTHTTSS